MTGTMRERIRQLHRQIGTVVGLLDRGPQTPESDQQQRMLQGWRNELGQVLDTLDMEDAVREAARQEPEVTPRRCSDCGEALTGSGEDIHQCKDGGEAMRRKIADRQAAWQQNVAGPAPMANGPDGPFDPVRMVEEARKARANCPRCGMTAMFHGTVRDTGARVCPSPASFGLVELPPLVKTLRLVTPTDVERAWAHETGQLMTAATAEGLAVFLNTSLR